MIRLLSLLTLITVVLAAADVKKTSGQVPSNWKIGAASSSTASFNFTLHLVGRNMTGLSTRMNQIVADQKGAWLDDGDLAQYVSPTDAATKAVTRSSGFLASSITTNRNGDRVMIKTTVGKTSKAFSATMMNYNADGPTISRARSYIIPASISAYVEDISPLALFGSINGNGMLNEEQRGASIMTERHPSVHQTRANTVPTSCNVSSVTPTCRKDYYGTSSYKRSNGIKSQADVAVIGFNNQHIDDGLISAFIQKYAKNIPSNYVLPVSAYNSAVKSGNPGFEAILNAEAVLAEIYPLTTNYVSMASIDDLSEDPWLLAFNTVIEQFTAATRPKVLSISYSGLERYFSASQGKIMCDAAQKLTALGTTIVVSTGDYGVGGDDGESCPPFLTRYPIGCEYILSVGATEGFAPEQPMEPNDGGLGLLSSGSGASNLFAIPSYQAKAVKAYQKTIGPLNGMYNLTGRMYPDVTAQGSRYSIIFGGRDTVGSGTSASTPYVASLIALINDKRKTAKKGTVGWANPPLYTASLHDITVGGSYGCKDTKYGFPSKPGFDAASGNGSPMFAALSTAYGV